MDDSGGKWQRWRFRRMQSKHQGFMSLRLNKYIYIGGSAIALSGGRRRRHQGENGSARLVMGSLEAPPEAERIRNLASISLKIRPRMLEKQLCSNHDETF